MTYRREIETAAKAHGLDPDLVAAVVEQESSGRFYAYRFEPAFYEAYLEHNPAYKGRIPQEVSASYGLMQTMFSTAVEHGYAGDPWGLFDPRVSLEYGCRVLARLLRGRTVHDALAAYNGGIGGIGKPRPSEYARSVVRRLDHIKGARASKADIGADVPGGGAS